MHPLQMPAQRLLAQALLMGGLLAFSEHRKRHYRLQAPLVRCLLQRLHNRALSPGFVEGLPQQAVHGAALDMGVITNQRALAEPARCSNQLTSSTASHSRSPFRLTAMYGRDCNIVC